MLVAAALVPQTALMVPGAGGSATVLADARAAALTTLADVIATDPDLVVVVVPGAVDGSQVLPPRQGRPTLAAAGIPDTALPWLSAGAPDGEPADPGPDAAVTAVTDV
ncbi:MAG: hypothetical protein JWP95_1169, partial [Actinotalea sp.]|nr:hypothetical protein [Actinotalea sp.]